MRIVLLSFVISLIACPAFAWEVLVTKDGTRVEGDITQAEFVLDDPTGGEIIIPRAAIDHFESGNDMVTATLKDGTSVQGHLAGKVEIEDGPIRRRYEGADIQRIDFDNYIAVESGTSYHSCPIRLSLPATVLTSERPASSTSVTGAVKCHELRILNVAFSRSGNISKGKDGSVSARFMIQVPEGADQLAELSLDVLQDGELIGTDRERLGLDEGETNQVSLKVSIPGEKFRSDGPEPRFRIQLVSQDEDRDVERGGFFWWFTIPLPL